MPHRDSPPSLAARLVATIIDLLPLGFVWLVVTIVVIPNPHSKTGMVGIIGSVVLLIAFVGMQFLSYANRTRGLGYWVMGLRLVRGDGERPIGAARFAVRGLFLVVMWGTVIPGVLSVVAMSRQRDRRSWADLAVDSMVVHSDAAPDMGDTVTSPKVSERPERATVWRSETKKRPQRAAEADRTPQPARAVVQPVEAPEPEGWCMRLDDGREFDIGILALVGRSPKGRIDEPQASLITAGGDARLVSKTHLAVGMSQNRPYLIDRESTNGTTLLTSRGRLEECPPGIKVWLSDGDMISFGNRWLTIRRGRARV